jgi:hypothetical protein
MLNILNLESNYWHEIQILGLHACYLLGGPNGKQTCQDVLHLSIPPRFTRGHITLDVPHPKRMLNISRRELKIELSMPVSASAVHSPYQLVIAHLFPYRFRIFGPLVIVV